ncbi:type I restriction/modification system, S subunit [Campylobacter lanienae NCTC 13004]|uniref:Type I restriction/modification system, S subunit n=1 Tax=Campylobacter lanienae NCTC 13004 TaxID=1031753 RepID=A0A1X9SL20_9BACT|nr:type I restriction/modification system, S subunit [Campylobacter lanienae NCTC 13004]
MFDIVGTKSLDSNAVDFVEHGINFVGRTFENNGIQGKIKKQKFEPNAPFTITATVIGNYKYVKYQKEPYYCSQNINKLTPKPIFIKWSEKIAIFLMTNIWRFVSMYDGQQGGYKLDDIKNHKIKLPITASGEIDFDFMESFIAELEAERVRELEAERVRELEAYLKASGLSDTTLNPDEKSALNTWNSRIWQEFRIGDLFDIKTTSQKLSKKDSVENGKFPIYSAESQNGGICGYCNEIPAFTISNEKPFFVIFGDHTKAFNIVKNDFCVADNVKVLEPKFFNIKFILFIIAVWQKGIPNLGYARHWSVAKNIQIKLPITASGEIDFDFMESFIKAIQKECIKGVGSYLSKNIATTKEIIKR